MSKPALKVKVRVQRFVTTTVDLIKINGNVWWPTIATSMNPTKVETISDTNKPCLLFVHQWSKMGGAGQLMEGMAYMMTLKNQYTSITFDMRGVGKSTGSSTWSGSDEINDVLSVCEWIKLNISKPIILIGSSAGAPIAGSAFGHMNYNYIIGGVFIGYPFGFLSSIIFGKHYEKITNSNKPKLFIHGSDDGFTSVKQLNNYIDKCKGDINQCYVEKDIGHFGLESPQFDETVCELVHEFACNIGKNVDIKLWHERISNYKEIVDTDENEEEEKNGDGDVQEKQVEQNKNEILNNEVDQNQEVKEIQNEQDKNDKGETNKNE